MSVNKPLVSIIVLTYNSSKYVKETLDSIKKQSYDNIELIVSDDCSSDNTLEVVEDWILNNGGRFVRTDVLSVQHNTGVTANYNRAIRACQGIWVKNVDGDDILLPSCIEDNIFFSEENPEAQIILSNSIVFFDNGRNEELQIPGSEIPSFFDLDANGQFDVLKKKEVLLNPNSQFAKTELIRSIGYDERIRNMEDRPFLWNCSMHGVRFYYLNKKTVRYRKYEGSLTGLAGKRLISLLYNDSLATFYYVVKKPVLEANSLDNSRDEKRILWFLFVKYVLKNKGNIFTRILQKCVNRWLLR